MNGSRYEEWGGSRYVMEASTKVYVAGHGGLAGGAIVRALSVQGYERIATRTHSELDLEDARATREFFEREQPEVVFLAAGRVGGIAANSGFPVDFLLANLKIAANVIESAHAVGVKRLIYLGSSCIYPRECPQPMREEHLLSGPLEATNRPYALAKIAGIEACWAFNRQYGTRFLAAMPTNLYGRGDNYHLQHAHVLPALIRKIHEAKAAGREEVVLWGSGTPQREFLHADDLARGLVFLASLDDRHFAEITDPAVCPVINVGTGEEITIRGLADLIAEVIGYQGRFVQDRGKPDGTMRKVMDISRMRALGWSPSIGLREGLAMAYQDFLLGGGRR